MIEGFGCRLSGTAVLYGFPGAGIEISIKDSGQQTPGQLAQW